MIQSSSTQLFYNLLRVALGNSNDFPENVTSTQWEEIYDIAKKQTLSGIAFLGVEKLSQEKRPQKDLVIKWYLYCERIKKENIRQDEYAHKVSERFLKDGFRNAILKGQGIAQLYPSPQYRHPGDIDIWLDGTREEVIRYIDTISPDSKPVYHHVDFPVLKDIDIEVHFTPSWMNEYFTNQRLQEYFRQNADNAFTNSIVLSDGYKICVPTLSLNRVFILLHIYRHLFAEGVGLRQILDYYMVLNAGFTPEEREETVTTLKHLRLYSFSRAVMYVLQNVFGMSDKYLISPPDKKQGEFLLNEIMLAGNFGAYDKRMNDKLYSRNPLVRFIYKSKRSLRFLRYHPLEIISSPFFRIWHFFWRRIIKNRILNSSKKD